MDPLFETHTGNPQLKSQLGSEFVWLKFLHDLCRRVRILFFCYRLSKSVEFLNGLRVIKRIQLPPLILWSEASWEVCK